MYARKQTLLLCVLCVQDRFSANSVVLTIQRSELHNYLHTVDGNQFLGMWARADESCAAILEQSMGLRNLVGIGLSYRARQATQPGGIDSLELIQNTVSDSERCFPLKDMAARIFTS